MATMVHNHQHNKVGARRIILGIVLFIALLIIAWAVRSHNHAAAPASQQNVPLSGQVNQGNNSSQDTVPSQNGTSGVSGAGR